MRILTKETIRQNICTNLKSLRKSKGLNQSDIAKLINVSRSSYQKYEFLDGNGQPSLLVLAELADFYNTTIDQLVGRTPCEDKTLETIKRNMAILRIREGFSAEEAAQKLNISTGEYLQYENSFIAIPADILCRITDLYGISMDELFGKTKIWRYITET